MRAPENQQVLERLVKLHQMKDSGNIKQLPSQLACPICLDDEVEDWLPDPERLDSLHAVYLHVTSAAHK